METDLAPIVEVPEEINQDTPDHDPSLPFGGKTSRTVSRRASLFRRFFSFLCCSHATTKSMSRRCSIQIVSSGSSSPPSERSSPTAQVGQTNVLSPSDELYLSPSVENFSEQDKSSIQSPASKGSDSIQAEDLTPQSYVPADELSLDKTITDRGNIPSPASEENISGPGSEESDTTESEDSTSQGYVTADELSLGETASEQDKGNIPAPWSEESDITENEDSTTSQGFVTGDEFTVGNTISEHERRSMPSPVSEKSDSTQYEDSTAHGYVVVSDDLSLSETISEHDRGNIPHPAYEGYDLIEYEDSASDINELTQDSFPQPPSSPLSIESTFPPQNSATGTFRRAFQQTKKNIRRADGLRNVSNM